MLKSNSNSSIDEFSDFQKQVICGILLGDASLQYFSRASRTPALTTVHSEAQKDYSQHLASLLGGICKSRNRKEDPRTGKVYKSYDVRTPGNKYFLDIYSNIYDLNKKKVPTVEFLENFTEVSLAYWFMDDGYISMKQSFEQRDFICSFKYDGREGFIYAQASPTSCIQSMGLDPVYSTDTAVMYIGGKYTPITDLVYDVGGNHRNDNFRFTFEGKVYEYDHSSYGWGYRKCHTMDCLRVYEADGETEILDGCASFDEDLNNVRKLPIVCRFADEEGKFDDFTDTFEICEGDFRLQ